MTLTEIRQILADAGIDSAAFEAEILVEELCHVPRARILAQKDADYDSPGLRDAIAGRVQRIPLQYILGVWEFCGLPFTVNENCLIPRPDTEVIVERAVRELPAGGRLLDLCTGSGCIAAAVLHFTKHTAAVAVDLYPETAAVAEKNFASLGLAERVKVLTGDALTDLFVPDEKFDTITANPPYVTAEEMQTLEPELFHEPAHALTDGADGLTFYRAITGIYKNHLTEGGCIIFEHGWQQQEAVAAIAEANGMHAEPIRDYGGNVRGAVLRFQP